MKSVFVYLLVSGSVLLLAGCSGGAGLLNGKETVPSAANVPVGNTLAMPPDLQLAPPGGTVDAYQPNGRVASAAPPAAPAPIAGAKGNLKGAAPASRAAPIDVFEQYGISKVAADGTKKTQQQLNDELAAAIRRKKQQANPDYGTISNIGSIFKD